MLQVSQLDYRGVVINQRINFKQSNYHYFESVNTFVGNKRSVDELFELTNLYLDIDFKLNKSLHEEFLQSKNYNLENFLSKLLDVIFKRCEEINIPQPNQINFSGNGLHLYWTIKPVNDTDDYERKLYGANALTCLNLYSLLLKKLFAQFEDLGADPNCLRTNGIMRQLNTINPKNGEECRSIHSTDNQSYLKEFTHLLDYSLEEYNKWKYEPTSLKQIELAKELGINNLSKHKRVAHKQIANKINQNKSKRFNGSKLYRNDISLALKQDWIMILLHNYFIQGLFKRDKGVTNNIIYLLGICYKRTKTVVEDIDNFIIKLKPKLKLYQFELAEAKRTFLSGYNAEDNKLYPRKKVVEDKLKIDPTDEVSTYVSKQSRATKQIIKMTLTKMIKNRKLILDKNYSCRKLAELYPEVGKTTIAKLLKQLKKISDLIDNKKTVNIENNYTIIESKNYSIIVKYIFNKNEEKYKEILYEPSRE